MGEPSEDLKALIRKAEKALNETYISHKFLGIDKDQRLHKFRNRKISIVRECRERIKHLLSTYNEMVTQKDPESLKKRDCKK